MPTETRTVSPGPRGTVITEDGQKLTPPADWELLPPGDAGLTRKVKAGGPTWTVIKKRGRKTFSQGVWAPADRIAAARAEVDATRSTATYARRKVADAERRDRKQAEYVEDFEAAVREFLGFRREHHALEEELAREVAAHATPVGSGTVARTQRIPIERRAEAAVIAWMRHQTTAYDDMEIPRVKGLRREVRRQLAARSRELLNHYRRRPEPRDGCPLVAALDRPRKPQPAERPPEPPVAPPPPKPGARGGWARG